MSSVGVEVKRVRDCYCNFCAGIRGRDGARAKDVDMVQIVKQVQYTSSVGDPLTINFRVAACRDCLRRIGSMLKRPKKK